MTLRTLWMLLATLVPAAAYAAPGDADGLDLESRPGPAVWIEEHWDVVPEKFKEFLEVYDREIYALARQTPGYRGYTVTTTLPAQPGDANQEQCGPDKLCKKGLGALTRSGRIGIQGRVPGVSYKGQPHERSINWDALMQYGYNVLIIHHVQTWADADQFRARMASLYAKANPGKTHQERIAETLWPLATVYWEADFRTLLTSWPALDTYTQSAGPRRPTDADGLNLEPRPGALVMVSEEWDVKPEKLCDFVKAYDKAAILPVRKVQGYRGYTIVTRLPPQRCEKMAKGSITAAALKRLGGSDELYPPSPSITQDGALRGDIRINVGALSKKTYTVLVRHQIQRWEVFNGWARGAPGGGYQEVYEREHGKKREPPQFPYAENHTDSALRLIRTSFVGDAP